MEQHGVSVCLSVGQSVTIVNPVKQMNWLRCHLGCEPKAQGTMLDGDPDPIMQRGNSEGEELLHLQDNSSTMESEHWLEKRQTKCISVAGNCWKVIKYDVHILWLTVSDYELLKTFLYICLLYNYLADQLS